MMPYGRLRATGTSQASTVSLRRSYFASPPVLSSDSQMSPFDNLIKEAAEEASIPKELARRARPAICHRQHLVEAERLAVEQDHVVVIHDYSFSL